jgi:NADPH-dependent curcumin reductase CurA
MGGWETVTTMPASAAQRIRRMSGVPLTASLSVLGSTGLTAWYGMVKIGEVKEGDTVVVSAAAGAVGSVAGQIAKLRGARVVGIAGGEQKCRWLTEDLGFDGAIDYKNEDVPAALDRLCPQGIDLDFENVGGPIMQTVYERMNVLGRMAVCGLISSYDGNEPMPGPGDFSQVLMKRLRIQGLLLTEALALRKQALHEMLPWIEQGRLRWKDHVVPGIENAVEALQRLFTGQHDGKLLLAIAPER